MTLSETLRPVAVLIVGLCLAGTPGARGAAKLTLVEAGEARAAIVLGARPVKAARFGAAELQHHVREMTGVELPVVTEGSTNAAALVGQVLIHIGDTARARELGLIQEPFAPQEYAIRQEGREIFLAGCDASDTNSLVVVYALDQLGQNRGWPGRFDAQGSLYAVYQFLEDACGVRWLNEYPSGTLLPQGDTLRVKVATVRRAPSFVYRAEGGDHKGLWKRGTDEHEAYLKAAYPELATLFPSNRPAFAAGVNWLSRLHGRRLREGGEDHHCNHSFYGYYERFSEAHWQQALAKATTPEEKQRLLERKQKRFEGDRPEYFAKGFESSAASPQLCYANPALIAQVVQDARDYYDGRKSGADLGVWFNRPMTFPLEPMDNGSFCRCDACASLRKPRGASPFFARDEESDYHFHFVNEVAKGLRSTHPGAELATLAYAGHAGLPGFPLDPMVTLHYCFDSSDAPTGSPFYENGVGQLREWAAEGRQVNRKLFLWLYNGNGKDIADNKNLIIFPPWNFPRFGEQMRLFHKLGYRGLFHTSPFEVDGYLMLKLAVDHSADAGQLLREYFDGLYGKGGKFIRAMCGDIARRYLDNGLRPEGVQHAEEVDWKYLGSDEKMAEWQGSMDKAKSLAATERERRNVELLDMGAWAYMRKGKANFTAMQSSPPPQVQAPMLPPAGGDPSKAAWDQAALLPDTWCKSKSGDRSTRSFSGRVAHDGEYFYIELIDECDTSKLVVQPQGICPYDDWEIFLADRRGGTCRQAIVGVTGKMAMYSRGEVNFRTFEMPGHGGMRVHSDTSSGNRWVTRLAIPLAEVYQGGVRPGGTIFLNASRVASPNLTGERPFSIDSWVSFGSIHDTRRLGEIELMEGK